MKDSAGKLKIALIAFGNVENVLSHAKAMSSKVDLTLIFVFAGSSYQGGILKMDLAQLPYGLSNDHEKNLEIIPDEIKKFIGNSFRLWFVRTPSRKILRDKWLKNFRIIRSASSVIRKEGFNLIHFNGSGGFVGYFHLLLPGYPKLWTLHDYKSHSGEESTQNNFVNKFYTYLNFDFLQHYKYLQKEFVNYFAIKEPERVHQVYTGKLDIYHNYDDGKFSTPTNYILFFGRISRYKGLDRLVEAFNRLTESNKDVKLVIAGGGKLWFDREVITINDQIIFLHRYIETNELAALIKNCLFVVAPYTDATHSAVVISSYAFNKPVLATDVGGLSEVIRHGITGMLIPPDDSEALYGALKEMTSDTAKLKSMGEHIEKLEIPEMSWDFIGDKMVDIYKKTISRQH
ncbi:MAG: glycosyltransferase family 4 protein [Bacteroidetes bacterium]|nr:glycosyltransferase family 4 protein [Bacteroidota bacterium]